MKIRSKNNRASKVGIYLIINKLNGNFYIGSTKFFTRRFSEHRKDLRRNRHTSQYLQNAYNKYGESNFVFHRWLIFPSDTDDLTLRHVETSLLHRFKPPYNMVLDAICSKMSEVGKLALSKRSSKTYILTDPDGNEHKVINLFQFCLTRNIKPKGLYEVAAGRVASYMGWKARFFGEDKQRKINTKSKNWIVTMPDGEKIFTDNLAQICRDNKFPRGSLGRIANSSTGTTLRGWWCERLNTEKRRSDDNGARSYQIISPHGEKQVIHNLARFCRENGLPYMGMNRILLGLQKHCRGYACSRIGPCG